MVDNKDKNRTRGRNSFKNNNNLLNVIMKASYILSQIKS